MKVYGRCDYVDKEVILNKEIYLGLAGNAQWHYNSSYKKKVRLEDSMT
jgi:hypothetical protein